MSFQPTHLYIKQHSVTGKCYFGKTTQKDPIKYMGGGLHWTHHIKKHGIEHVKTLWHKLFMDKAECTKIALLFSEQQDIVKSDRWLNMKPENGLDGGGNHWKIKSIEHQAKIANALKDKKFSPEICSRISQRVKGAGNSRALDWLIEDEKGNTVRIKSLKTWCAERQIAYSSLTRTSVSDKFYHGLKVRRL